ncbi:hypothetical protein [Enterococcus sp. RIT-PI-f]|uniref:hypothetical protein n=1 Tax=Enterococcus sp. RIT-PI-f TaxID=1690244 RepID=UPI0006B9CF50|nr:hypothetical protein [Enterococcus sp. RIT-PI-f]KPG70131.1 hypothetical protein AEQ18_09515 [Enterococcus sp. RIT-PI-f]
MEKMRALSLEELKNVKGGASYGSGAFSNPGGSIGKGRQVYISDNNCSNRLGLPARIIAYIGGGRYKCETI